MEHRRADQGELFRFNRPAWINLSPCSAQCYSPTCGPLTWGSAASGLAAAPPLCPASPRKVTELTAPPEPLGLCLPWPGCERGAGSRSKRRISRSDIVLFGLAGWVRRAPDSSGLRSTRTRVYGGLPGHSPRRPGGIPSEPLNSDMQTRPIRGRMCPCRALSAQARAHAAP